MILINLGYLADDFKSSLDLFEFSRNPSQQVHIIQQNQSFIDVCKNWKRIAARDGAITIYHFGIALKGLSKANHQCSITLSQLDETKIGEANKIFNQNFPNYDQIRNSVAHSSEKIVNTKKHSVTGLTINDGLFNDSFTTTWRMKLFRYNINQNTLNVLNSVTEAVWTAYDGVQRHFKKS